MKKNFSKLLALYLPYILLGLAATNFGEAWRCLLYTSDAADD